MTFFGILAYTILIPLLPFVARRFGASDATAGTLLTTTALFATLSSPLWGGLSDRFGRKRALIGSQLLSFAGYIVLALAPDIALLFFSRVVEGLGGGNVGVAQSYISDVTDEEQRPRAFAYSSAAFGAGFIVGPILSGSLVHFGYAVPFFVAAAVQLLNAILTLTLLPESHGSAPAAHGWRELASVFGMRALRSLLARQFLFIFAFTYLFSTFSLYISHVLGGGPELSSLLLGVAGGTGGLMMIFGVGPLVARFGQNRVTTAAFLAGALSYASVALAHTLLAVGAVLVFWALSGSVLRPVLSAQISEEAPEDERGLVLGFSDALNNLAMIVTPLLGAAIVGFNAALSGVLPALALAGGFALGLRDRRR
ncbi:MAG: MFS transporter [Candidatus Baltobacteraceae bacterium]